MKLPNFKQEKKIFQLYNLPIIAVDEAGRGPLAGPVTAGAILIKNPYFKSFKPPLKIKDSKKLKAQERQILYLWITQQKNLKFSYASVGPKIIDKINIRNATMLAMTRAIKKLNIKNYILLLDGKDKLNTLDSQIKQYAFIKGDEKLISLSLASIVAKVKRDKLMINLSKKYPEYFFENHKGYGTKIHYQQIKKYGISEIHRISFLKNLNNKYWN
jgi:ribonuclease HII